MRVDDFVRGGVICILLGTLVCVALDFGMYGHTSATAIFGGIICLTMWIWDRYDEVEVKEVE